MKFRPGQPVWCLSAGEYEGPEGKFKGIIVRYKRSGMDANTGDEIEEYVVAIPALGGTWLVTTDFLRPRVEDVRDPPGMTDETPNAVTTWDRCVWQPGDHLRGQGRIYVP